MFYITKYMQDNLYYMKELNTYVLAEIEDHTLTIHMVISDSEQDLLRIAESFGQEIHSVVLGFTPKNTTGFEIRQMNQDDRTFHIKGNGFTEFENAHLMFPLLAHA